MEPGPDFQAERANLFEDGARTADSSRGPVEAREEAVSGGVHLVPR